MPFEKEFSMLSWQLGTLHVFIVGSRGHDNGSIQIVLMLGRRARPPSQVDRMGFEIVHVQPRCKRDAIYRNSKGIRIPEVTHPVAGSCSSK